MIKILHIVPKLSRDGISTFILNYLQAFDKEDIVFDFICMQIDSDSIVSSVEKHGGRVFTVPLLSLRKILSNFYFILSFFYKKHKEYDVIHVHQIGAGFFYLFIAWIFRIPKRIAHSHSTMYSANKKKALIHKIFTQTFLGANVEIGKDLFGFRFKI